MVDRKRAKTRVRKSKTTARNDADYNREMKFTRDDAERWFSRAQEYVDTIEKLLPTLLEKN